MCTFQLVIITALHKITTPDDHCMIKNSDSDGKKLMMKQIDPWITVLPTLPYISKEQISSIVANISSLSWKKHLFWNNVFKNTTIAKYFITERLF